MRAALVDKLSDYGREQVMLMNAWYLSPLFSAEQLTIQRCQTGTACKYIGKEGEGRGEARARNLTEVQVRAALKLCPGRMWPADRQFDTPGLGGHHQFVLI